MPNTETHFELTAGDGHPVQAHRWQGPAPRAIVQLAHGMGEHSLRYRPLADALTQSGCVVYANEHRGHGQGASDRGELGEFGPRGFAGLVDDMVLLSRHARAGHPGLPLILLGHSMGSFAVQYYLARHSELLAGAVLSGTTALDLLGAALQGGFRLEDMNATLPDVRTPFDWLSRDPAQVDAYIADPLCGFTVSAEGLGTMFANLAEFAPDALRERIRPELPLYLFVGDQDPVSHNADWFHPLVQRYREAGLRDVSCHVFGGARHETLNETNREEVVAMLLAWIARVVGQHRGQHAMSDTPIPQIPTLYQWLGGIDALTRLTTRFYENVKADPLLAPVFAHMDGEHPAHVAAFLAEVLGGPADYSKSHGGHPHMIRQHLNRHLQQAQRRRWVALLLETADELTMPDDPEFRSALVGYLEWGSRLAVINSQAGATVNEDAPMPAWGWGEVKGPYTG